MIGAKVYMDGNEVLLCPKCGGDYLHQGEVQTFFRSEDADQTRVTISGFDHTRTETITNSLTLNPSPRRYGLRISFWCELCESDKTDEERDYTSSTIGDLSIGDLCIYQHKGQTFIEWDIRD